MMATAKCSGMATKQKTARYVPASVCRRLYVSGAGFTLVELVVTIVIIGILSSLGGMFISKPIESYIDLERRTELVDQAEMALRRMQRDIRAALPNSVRTFAGGKGIEFLHVVDGGRYRRSGVGDPLEFLMPDSTSAFDVLGKLKYFDKIKDDDFVVVYNLVASGTSQNAYNHDNEVEINLSASSDTFIALDPPAQFPLSSPYQRFFIVDKAVSYKIVGTELRRYAEDTFDNNPGPADDDSYALVAKHLVLSDSDFTYDSGTNSRGGLVTIRLALEDTVRAPGERITLLHQVHVDNAP